jgi:hypothetical protein
MQQQAILDQIKKREQIEPLYEMFRLRNARQKNRAEVGEKHIAITPVVGKAAIEISKFDQRAPRVKGNRVTTDDEVADPESNDESPRSKKIALRTSPEHTPRG